MQRRWGVIASGAVVLCGCPGEGDTAATASQSTSAGTTDATSGSSDATTGAGSGEGATTSAATTTGVDASTTAGEGPIYDVGTRNDIGTSDCFTCSADMHEVIGCEGQVVATCDDTEACDTTIGGCAPACLAVAHNQSSVGCEYWATKMDHSSLYDAQGVCFAAFVANTWSSPVTIEVEFDGALLPVEDFTRVPVGAGPGLMLDPYDNAAGLPPGEVAIVFLSGPTGAQEYGKEPCPIAPAIAPEVMVPGTAIGKSFRIATDAPVVAYQMNPYGAGAGGAVAGASLLLPTSTWDTNYIAVDAYQPDLVGEWPSLNVVANEDATTVTLLPIAAVQGGGGLPGGPAAAPLQFVLDRGEHAQFTQQLELTGSVLGSDKPVGLMAGHNGLRVPVGVSFADHAEQMIPPVRALGTEYVGVMHQPRDGEPAVWRIVGAVDGTMLTWSSDVGGPMTIDQGQIAELVTPDAFVVASQDVDHPFMLFTYMSGSTWNLIGPGGGGGSGDSDFVLGVPPQQYLERYVFFMDPSYPEGSIVLVRAKEGGAFADVTLDCLGVVGGWQAVGEYEWTRVGMSTGDYQPVGPCFTGAHLIESDGPFGLWVWGWGAPATVQFTQNRSYGFPGGMNVRPINDVVIDPEG